MDLAVTKSALGLKVVLKEEVAILSSLLEVMQEERALLVSFKPNQLLEINKRKELLVLQHTYLEQNRKDLSRQLAAALNITTSTEEPRLAELADAIGGEIGCALLDQKSKLVALIDAIQELNSLNSKLIEFSIRSVKGSVAFLKRHFFYSETYSANGVLNNEISQLSTVHSRA